MFARGPATEVLAGHENTGSGMARMVQGERGVVRTVLCAAPVIEQKFAEASALDSLQELLGDDLVGIDVGAMERSDFAFVRAERLHLFSKLSSGRDALRTAGR